MKTFKQWTEGLSYIPQMLAANRGTAAAAAAAAPAPTPAPATRTTTSAAVAPEEADEVSKTQLRAHLRKISLRLKKDYTPIADAVMNKGGAIALLEELLRQLAGMGSGAGASATRALG